MRTVKLGDVMQWSSGGTPKRSESQNFEGPYPWASIADLTDGYVSTTRESLTEQGIASSSAKIVPANTLLVAMYGSIGKLGISAMPLCTSQAIATGIPDLDAVNLRYIFHFLLHAREHLRNLGRGGTQQNIGQKDLKDLRIPLPPLTEQRRIAAILDQADALRTKRRQQLTHLDALPQAILRRMALQDFPWIPVGDVGQVQLGRQRAPKYQTGRFSRPYMRVANVQLDHIDTSDVSTMDFDDADFRAYKLEYGDILLNEGQSTELVGRPAMWRNEIENCCFQNTLLRFRTDTSKLIPEFALSVFTRFMHDGTFARVSSKTSNVAHLGKSRFERILMPVPPLSVQHQFKSAATAIIEQKRRLAMSESTTEALFASLQARAFRGEL